MTKTAKTTTQWVTDLQQFVQSNRDKLGKGGAPSSGQWKDEYDNIRKCPKHNCRGGTQLLLSFASNNSNTTSSCTCGWHDGTNQLLQHIPRRPTQQPNITRTSSASVPTNSPPIILPFLIPEKPSPRKSIDDVKNKSPTYPGKTTSTNIEFDLTVFGHTDGDCPHCGGRPNELCKLNISLKLVHTIDKPRYMQGVGMSCSSCQKTWQSYEKGYVDTLPKYKQQELNAIVVGKSDGIDMGLVTMLRSGASALSVERTCIANLHRWNHQLKDDYTNRCQAKKNLGLNVVERVFPAVDEGLAAKQSMLMKAFIRDYLGVRDGLNREMASYKSSVALAVDHQAKVVRHAKGGDATQSFTVVGDGNVVLAYCAVPNEDMKWVEVCMKEIVERHGAILDPDDCHQIKEQGDLPYYVYVDKDCCNGKEGGRTDANKYFFGMLKLLDAFHLILRIGREMNSEHARKPNFMRQLSQCIFTTSADDARALNDAREAGAIYDLNGRQLKYDRKFVRRVIREPSEIASKMLVLLKTNIAMDREARLQFEKSGLSCDNLTPAHDAYPLITKKVKKCVMMQCTHVLNGCVSDQQAMNVKTGESNYRNTGITLPTYQSLRGSSKVEVVHSVTDRAMYTFNNIRQITFDARVHWKITNYNRQRMRDMNKFALPDSVAPSEVDHCNIVPSTTLRFGFDYCHYVMEKTENEIQNAIIAELDSDTFTMDIADYDIEAHEGNADGDDAATDVAADAPSHNMDELSAGPFTAEIPDVVDFSNLDDIGNALDDDLGMTLDSLPNVEPEDIAIELEPGIAPTLAGALDQSNRMAVEAGIDLDTTGASDRVQYEELQHVNGRRNVGLRRRQNQQTPNVTPAFNNTMLAKWTSIWSDPEIPQPQKGNTTYLGWYFKAVIVYERWRMAELSKAKDENRPPPPLYFVKFRDAKQWAMKMKQLSNSAHASGVVNEATSELCANLDTLLSNVSDDNDAIFGNDDGIGAAMNVQNLNTHVAAASSVGPQLFNLPTSAEVNAVLGKGTDAADSEIVKLLQKEKPRPKQSKVKPQLQARIDKATENMDRLGIVRDAPSNSNSKKRKCTVCGKAWLFELNNIPHRIMMTEGEGTKQFRFCPLADDHNLLKEYLVKAQEKEKARLREINSSRKKRKGGV